MRRPSPFTMPLSRREFLKSAGAIPLGTALAGLPLRDAFGHASAAGYRPELFPQVEKLWNWIEHVNSKFGPQRFTASPQHVGYVDWLADHFSRLGCNLQFDHYTMQRWDANMSTDIGASITLAPGQQSVPLDVLSYYPYAGSTLTSGPVTGTVIYVPIAAAGQAPAAAQTMAANPPANLANSIVAFECPCPSTPPVTAWGVYPPNLQIEAPYKSQPYQIIFAGLPSVFAALDGKCKGLLFIWTDVSDDGARDQYTPFGGAQRKIPALWVGQKAGPLLKTAAASGGTVTMKLNARLFPNSPTDTVIATLPGMTDEIVTVGSHTDGCNIAEENGAIGVLALATYAARIPASQRKRTLAFILATGHFAGGALSDPNTATGPNGQKGVSADAAGAFRDHPEIVAKTVATLAMEHLGTMEWKDDGASYEPTGLPDADNWYVGSAASGSKVPDIANQVMANVALSAAQGEPARDMRMEVEKSGQASPESSPAVSRGIPNMGLIPIPSYLVHAPPNGDIDKLNPHRLHAQVETITKMWVILDKLSKDQINGLAPVSSADLNPYGGNGRRRGEDGDDD